MKDYNPMGNESLSPPDSNQTAADLAFARIVAFMSSRNPDATLLAAHAAILETLRPEILSLIRLNFIAGPSRWNPALDAEVLYGPLSRNLGGGYFELDKEVRRQLLVALEAWSSRAGDREYRSRRVGRLVRQYVHRLRHLGTLADSPRFFEFLKKLDWIGLAYDEPFDAAQALMRLVSEAERQLVTWGSPPKIRFAGVTGLLELPLSAFGDGIDSARGVDALAKGDLDQARVLFASMMQRELTVGTTTLIAPQILFDKYMLATAQRQASTDSVSVQSEKKREPSYEVNMFVFEEKPLALQASGSPEEETLADNELHEAVRNVGLDRIEQLLATGRLHPDAPGISGKTALHLAARDGRSDICRLLLEAGAKVDSRDQDKATPLHEAASFGQKAVVDLLIDHGAEVDAKTEKESTPLILCAYYRHLEVAAKLLQVGADPYWRAHDGFTPACAAAAGGSATILAWLEAKGVPIKGMVNNSWPILHLAAGSGQTDCIKIVLAAGYHKVSDRSTSNGWTALHCAAFNGHAAAVELLLELGAEPDAPDNIYWSPLHVAAQEDHADVILTLMAFGASPTNRIRPNGYTPLLITAHHNSAQATKILLKNPLTNPNATAYDQYPLLVAAEKGFAETIRELLSCPTINRKVKKEGSTALVLAIKSKSLEAVEALLEDSKIDVNEAEEKTEELPLSIAIHDKVWDIVTRLVLDPRVNIDFEVKGNSVLYHAVEAGVVQAVRVTLDRGSDPHATKEDGSTLLHVAAKGQSLPVVDLLIERGANLNCKDIKGRTPLFTATVAGSAIQVSHFLGVGADRDLSDNYGRSPLHAAAMTGGEDLIIALLNADAPLESKDCNGMTPFHLAVCSGDLDRTRLLIRSGARLNVRSGNGWTALHFAAQLKDPAIAELLISHGVNPLDAGSTAGFTPLEAAAEVGALKVCELLLNYVARHSSADSSVTAAIELAATNCQLETVLLLLDAGENAAAMNSVSGLRVRNLVANHMTKWATIGLPVSDVETAVAKRLGLPERQASSADPSSTQDQESHRRSSYAVRVERPQEPQTLSPPSHLPLGWFVRGLLFDNPDANAPFPWVTQRSVFKDRWIELFNQNKPKHAANPKSTQVCATALPFYRNVIIFRLHDRRWQNPLSARYYLFHSRLDSGKDGTILNSGIEQSIEEGIYLLNGTSPPIHEINAKVPIQLNEKNVLDYVRFFCFFVRGEEGPFYLLEDMRDPIVPNNVPAIERDVIAGTIRPATYEGRTNKGGFYVDGVVFYSNALFIANFEVQPSGMVKMIDDEPIAGDLSVRINAPLL